MVLRLGNALRLLSVWTAIFWVTYSDLAFAQNKVEKWPIRLQLQYFHQFQFAGFYAAKFLGLYDKAGLDVEISEGEPQRDPVEAVLRGQADFGVSDTELLWHRLRGDPLVALGVVFQNSAYCLVSLSASKIMTLDDLRGKRLGISDGRGSYQFRAMFNKQKISLDEVTVVKPRWNLESLVRGETDANGAYATGELYRLRENNISFQVMYPVDYGVEFYGDTLFTSSSYLSKNPRVVEAFREASFQGWRYAFEHPEEVIDYILTLPSVRKLEISRDRLRYEATVMRHLILPNIIEIGSMSQKRWQKMAEDLQAIDPEHLRVDRLQGFIYELPSVQKMQVARRIEFFALGILLLLFLSLLWVLQLRHSVKQRTRDVEEARRLANLRSEEAKNANAAKTMFLANISHEFRTPLTAILGFSELLKTTILSDQQKSWLRISESRAQDLLALVNQTLELIQSESGAVSAKVSDFELDREIEEIEDSFDPVFRAKKIKFSKNIDPEATRSIRGPSLVLRQILTNLISNATKIVSEGGHIELVCREEKAQNPLAGKHRFHFSLIGDVAGVPDEIGPVIFDSFMHPLREQIEKRHQGFGLGLSICKRLVTSLGGEIWFENRSEGGCSFHFKAIFSDPLEHVPSETAYRNSDQKILIVDDDPVNRELIRTYLAMSGLSTVEADSGQKAIRSCEQELFTVILMDIGLPDIDGVKTSEKIMKNPLSKNKHTPIVALTASARFQERDRCLKAGMSHYLTKPINFKDLMSTIGANNSLDKEYRSKV